MCETCEEDALCFHDTHHAFIKIRYPIQSITRKVILPKFIPLGEKPVEMEEIIISNEITINTERSVASSSATPEKSLPVLPALPPITTVPFEDPIMIEPKLGASFISDINIPDGTTIVPKKTFIKVSGRCNLS